MTRRTYTLPITFTALSGLVFLLGIYILVTKSSLHPQFFITACGEVLKNVSEHVHFNPDGLLSSLILLITAMGSGLAATQTIRFALSHRRLSENLRETHELPEKLLNIMKRKRLGGAPISVITGKPTAYTIGLFRPRIVVSLSLIRKASDKQLEAVILHELYHLNNRHLLWILVSRLVSSLFFFIPVIEYLAQQLKTEFELAADSFVVERQKTREHLCDSLALNLQYAGGVIPHFATSPIEKRVESLLTQTVSFDKISTMRFGLSLCSIAIMIGLALNQPSEVAAGVGNDSEAVCRVGEKCQNKDCSHYVPASFSLSTYY